MTHPEKAKLKLAALSIVLLAMSGISPLAKSGGGLTSNPHGLLLVANKADRTLSLVDIEAGRQLAAVPVDGVTGHEVAASPDGRTAWVPIYGNSGVGLPGTDGRTISVIDLPSHKEVAQIDLGEPSRPHCALFGPDGRLYVTAEITQSIKVIDPATRKVVDSLPTGAAESHMMVLSNDGRRAYTANVGSGSVSVIDVQRKRVLAIIPVARIIQRIALSTDGRWIFTADQTKPQLAVIDTQTNSVSRWIPLPSLGYGIAPTRGGMGLLVAHPESDSVSFVDLQSMTVTWTIHVPAHPQEILADPDGHAAYVSCDKSAQIAEIALPSGKLEKTISVGAGADGLAWAPGLDNSISSGPR